MKAKEGNKTVMAHEEKRKRQQLEYHINLEVNSWKKIPIEQVMIAIISRAKHGELECRKAKDVELEKLKEWKAYRVVNDEV